jgi:hypothetical protein
MSGKRRVIFFIFIVLTFIDFYNCILPGQEFNQMIRPIQMLVLFLWVLLKSPFSIHLVFVGASLGIAAIADYVFYKYGSIHEKSTISIIILKNFCFLAILFLSIKPKIRLSKKLYVWAFRYEIIMVSICYLMDGFDNWLAYVIAIQSGLILLFISLKKSDSIIFKQLYFGYSLIILSLIFGKILLTDSRWFIELIDRISFIAGHLLFISGLNNIKLSPFQSKNLDFKVSN